MTEITRTSTSESKFDYATPARFEQISCACGNVRSKIKFKGPVDWAFGHAAEIKDGRKAKVTRVSNDTNGDIVVEMALSNMGN